VNLTQAMCEWMDDHVAFLKTPSDSKCQMCCGKFMRIRLYQNTDWMVGLFLLALNGPFSSFRNDFFSLDKRVVFCLGEERVGMVWVVATEYCLVAWSLNSQHVNVQTPYQQCLIKKRWFVVIPLIWLLLVWYWYLLYTCEHAYINQHIELCSFLNA